MQRDLPDNGAADGECLDAAGESGGRDDGGSGEGSRRPRVVIVGGGFAGLACAKRLKRADAEVLVIDRRNHHLFQPLLYQVATAALSPADIAEPIRSVLRRQRNARVLLDRVEGVETERRCVRTAGGREIDYDYLVVAAGARTNFFGHEADWPRHAPGLKTLGDAEEMRERFLRQFERAESAASAEERRELLTFVVIGGGPTGVELAGTISEVARRAIPPDFERVSADDARVVLVLGEELPLRAYPERARQRAAEQLESLGVELIASDLAEEIDDEGVTLKSGRRIEAGAMFWGAGVTPVGLAEEVGGELDEKRRVRVEDDLSVAGRAEVFVVGDLARSDRPGRDEPVPGIAAAAIQMGKHAGATIARELRRGESPRVLGSEGSSRRRFRYFDKGQLATIGRGRAVGLIGGRTISGPVAWLLWLAVHVVYLVGFRNRVVVSIQWAWSYVFFIRGARIIVARGSVGGGARGAAEGDGSGAGAERRADAA